MQPIVTNLAALIKTHGWRKDFEQAIRNAQAHNVPAIKPIQTLADHLRYINDLVTWAPRELPAIGEMQIRYWPVFPARTKLSSMSAAHQPTS